MTVLITGAAGWLGRELTRELEPHHSLRLLDRQEPSRATILAPGQAERAACPLETDWPYLRAEVTDEMAVRRATEGADAVVHLAGIVHGRPEQGKAIMEANVIGTYVVFDAARLAGVPRVLCASSVNAFGTIYWRLSGRPAPYTRMPLDESFAPVPEDPYSLSKWCGEETAAAFHRAYGMTTAAFRFASVWTEAMYQQRRGCLAPTQAWSDWLYQWVHARDIARGLRQALECETLPGCGVYTLGAADTTCPEPTMAVLERFRPDLAATVDPPLSGRAPLLSIERARAAFGYDPQYRLGP